MTDEQQPVSPEDAEERELEDAQKEFAGAIVNAVVDMAGVIPSKEETAKRYQDILIALGFTRYDNREKGIAYKLKAGSIQIGRTFTEKQQIGYTWVRYLTDCEHGKKGDFLKRDECKKIPLVALFYKIRDGKLPMPEPTVVGKVVGKTEKAVQIEFGEFGERRIETWGFGALKKKEEGTTYVPASYSKETEHYSPKMQIPRNIILENYESELAEAPLTISTDTGKHKEEKTEEEVEKVDKGTIADKIPHNEPVALTEGEKPTVDYYISLIGEITAKVQAEDRIPKGEWGYAISKVFDAITKDKRAALIAELQNKGGRHEGQA